jgi:hypothetical protein
MSATGPVSGRCVPARGSGGSRAAALQLAGSGAKSASCTKHHAQRGELYHYVARKRRQVLTTPRLLMTSATARGLQQIECVSSVRTFFRPQLVITLRTRSALVPHLHRVQPVKSFQLSCIQLM